MRGGLDIAIRRRDGTILYLSHSKVSRLITLLLESGALGSISMATQLTWAARFVPLIDDLTKSEDAALRDALARLRAPQPRGLEEVLRQPLAGRHRPGGVVSPVRDSAI